MAVRKRKLDRRRLRVQHNRIVDAVERPFFRRMTRWFREQERQVLDKLDRGMVGGQLREGLIAEDLTFDVDEEVAKFSARTYPYYRQAFGMGASSFHQTFGLKPVKPADLQSRAFAVPGLVIQKRVAAEVAWDMDDPGNVGEIQAAIQGFWPEVHNKTKFDLTREIKYGMRDGETTEQIRKRVQGVFEGTVRGTAPRARMIARTEINGAANYGSYRAALSSEVVDRKQWLSARDDDVRTEPFNHRISEVVPLRDAFLQTGEPMRFPGDPRGSVGNRVNCRCLAVMLPYEIPEVEIPTGGLPKEIGTLEEALDYTKREWEPLLAEYVEGDKRFGDLAVQIAATQDETARLQLIAESEELGRRMTQLGKQIEGMFWDGDLKATDMIARSGYKIPAEAVDRLNARFPNGVRNLTSAEVKQVDAALNKMGQVMHKDAWKGLKRNYRIAHLDRKTRAYHSNTYWTSCIRASDERVIWHEVAHHLEENKNIREATLQYYERRTANSSVERLRDLVPGSGYGDDEITKTDGFDSPYKGRIYEDEFTEVLSMGLSAMRDVRSMMEYWQKDPDNVYFVLTVVKGRVPNLKKKRIAWRDEAKSDWSGFVNSLGPAQESAKPRVRRAKLRRRGKGFDVIIKEPEDLGYEMVVRRLEGNAQATVIFYLPSGAEPDSGKGELEYEGDQTVIAEVREAFERAKEYPPYIPVPVPAKEANWSYAVSVITGMEYGRTALHQVDVHSWPEQEPEPRVPRTVE